MDCQIANMLGFKGVGTYMFFRGRFVWLLWLSWSGEVICEYCDSASYDRHMDSSTNNIPCYSWWHVLYCYIQTVMLMCFTKPHSVKQCFS